MKAAMIFAIGVSVFSTSAFAESVKLTGCPQNGVTAGCLVIQDNGGQTYNITAADPKPDPAQQLVITLTGETSTDVSICNQGIVLKNIQWSYTKMACRAGAEMK